MVRQPAQKPQSDDIATFMVAGKADDYIFREGDDTTDMYIIQKGEIEIVRSWATESQQSAVLEVGDFFGEMSLLEEQPRQVSAHALTDYKLLRIDHSTFDQMVQEKPEIAVRMLRKLSRRLRERQEADLRAAQIALGALRGANEPRPAPAEIDASEEARAEAVLLHRPSGAEFRLSAGQETSIGRRDRVTGHVPDIDFAKLDTKRTLSRRHAKILRREGRFYLRKDIGASNPTLVNGKAIEPGGEVKLEDGDQLRFGGIGVVFRGR